MKTLLLNFLKGIWRKLLAAFVSKEAKSIGIASELEKDLRSQTVTSKPTVSQSHLPAARARGLMQGQDQKGPQN